MAELIVKDQLLEIFDSLLTYFGPRHWWPGETSLEIIVGAILTQNVSWVNVEKAIHNLKREDLLTLEGLRAVPTDRLAELIRPTRFYNQKASVLKGFVNKVCSAHGGDLGRLLSMPTPGLRKELLSLKGIGPETADSILLYAANRPIFVVDAYTIRIFNRLGFLEPGLNYPAVQEFFMSNLPHETYLFNEYHALIVALGNSVCLARSPSCSICPLLERCRAKRASDDLPCHKNSH